MKVFKYRGGDRNVLMRDLNSLRTDHIFAAPIESLNDPHESYINANHENIRVSDLLLDLHSDAHVSQKIRDSESKFQSELGGLLSRIKKCGIYSLSRTKSSELLWAYYGDSHRGFCIEYDLEKLMEYSLKSSFLLDVDYQKDMPSIASNDIPVLLENSEEMLTRLIATKSQPWRHEEELRIVTNQCGKYDYDFRAVTGIYFGCRCSDQQKKTTMRLLSGRGLKYFTMKPSQDHYALAAEQIVDPYISRPKYRENYAPVDDGVPYVSGKNAEDAAALIEAIERARRDPYCQRVVDADFSVYDAVKGDPKVFVTYKRYDGVDRNMYFSRTELSGQE